MDGWMDISQYSFPPDLQSSARGADGNLTAVPRGRSAWFPGLEAPRSLLVRDALIHIFRARALRLRPTGPDFRCWEGGGLRQPLRRWEPQTPKTSGDSRRAHLRARRPSAEGWGGGAREPRI